MQTLLNEFQYKSVSSLYKMLRQKMLGTFRSFEEHYRVCRYELKLRIQDPRILTSCEDILARIQSRYCTAKEYLNIDVLIKGTYIIVKYLHQWRFTSWPELFLYVFIRLFRPLPISYCRAYMIYMIRHALSNFILYYLCSSMLISKVNNVWAWHCGMS